MADSYVYPNSNVLVNKLGIRDQALLDAAERQATRTRLDGVKLSDKQLYETSAAGQVHQQLFQDLYAWAGQQRTVNIIKVTAFLSASQIGMGLQEVSRQLRSNAPLEDLKGLQAAVKAGSRPRRRRSRRGWPERWRSSTSSTLSGTATAGRPGRTSTRSCSVPASASMPGASTGTSG